MSSLFDKKFPVPPAADRAEERAEREALRAVKSGMQEMIDGTAAAITALEGGQIGVVRATVQDVLRQQREIARAVKGLCRVVGGADR